MTYQELLEEAQGIAAEGLKTLGHEGVVVPVRWTRSVKSLAHAESVSVVHKTKQGKVLHSELKNKIYLNKKAWKHLLLSERRKVVLHEAAHVAMALQDGPLNPQQHGHCPGWAEKMRKLGEEPATKLSEKSRRLVHQFVPRWHEAEPRYTSKIETTKLKRKK